MWELTAMICFFSLLYSLYYWLLLHLSLIRRELLLVTVLLFGYLCLFFSTGIWSLSLLKFWEMSFLARCCRGCLISRHQLLSLSSSGRIIQSKRNIAAEALLSWYSALPQVLVTENVVLAVHSVGTGSWALDIIAMSCLGRIVLSGVATTYMRKILASHAITCKDVTQEKRRLKLDLKKRVSSGEMPPLLARELKMQAFAQLNKKHQDLILMYNNHPGKAYLALVIEGICWVTYGLSLRNITAGFPPDVASEAAVEMKSQSFLWITDLSLPDPYCVIPILSTTIFLSSSFFMKEWRRQNMIPDFHILQRFIPLPIAGIIFYMSTQLPCSITLFGLTNVIMAFAQAVLFTHPAVLQFLRIPQMSGRPLQPVSWKTFKIDRGWTKVRM